MPLQYPTGILKEHLHTRESAGLFDVSHMGQFALRGDAPAAALETLVPADVLGLESGRARYTQLTNANGGILDDLVVTALADSDSLLLVVNASRAAEDLAHLQEGLPAGAEVTVLEERALLALQGPAATAVLASHTEGDIGAMPFMSYRECAVAGIDCGVWRSGYTGEDGYEISCSASEAEALARALLESPVQTATGPDGAGANVALAGLGARDSLRIEAGLCLWGQDIDETTTPIEAGLTWSVAKRRRSEGGFPGDGVIQRQIADGPARRRVGIRGEGRAPLRIGVALSDAEGAPVGEITSGCFGPSVDGPVAMGYVSAAHVAAVREGGDTLLQASVRGRLLPARIAPMPFVAHRYYRG